MRVHEMVGRIQSKADLVSFVQALLRDLKEHPEEWENTTLELYLEALADWIEDSDGYYINRGEPVPTTPSWKHVADMLIAAKMYEG